MGSHLAESLVNKKNKLLLISKSNAKKANIDTIQSKIIHKKANITNFPKIGKIIDDFKPDMIDRKSTRLNSSHSQQSRMPSSA